MITVNIIGGLGNQMFQYSLGKHLALTNNTDLKIDVSLLEDHSSKSEKQVHRNFELDVFKMDVQFCSEKEKIYFNGKPRKKLIGKTYNFIRNFFTKKRLVIEKGRGFNKKVKTIKGNRCIVGGWQSPIYFAEIRKELIGLFTLSEKVLNKSSFQNYETLIKRMPNSTGLHVRRGDYVTNKYYNNLLGVLPKGYYEKAVNIIEKKCNQLSIFIFSDDMEWCKKNLSFNHKVIFVQNEKSKFGAAADMKLMSLCEHQIISNSTFAWWAAWLNVNELKTVIAPQQWVNKKYLNNPNVHSVDIIPSDWQVV